MPTESSRYADLSLSAFAEQLASAEATPGGGSASAVAGALAASLVSMVARLSQDRPAYAEHAETHAHSVAAGDELRATLLRLADEDAAAYAAFGAARRLPKETDEELRYRKAATETAARHAAMVPLDIVRACHRVVGETEALAGRSNTNASSDLDVAALLAEAAARGAGANVLVNLPAAGDEGWAGGMTAEVEGLLREIRDGVARVHQVVRSGSARRPERSA